MPLQDLPLEILLEIAKLHPWAGCELSKTVKKVGLYSLQNDVKRWFKAEENYETFILVKSSEEPYSKKVYHSWDDKFACIYSNGTKMWYKEGKRHRDNGKPAVLSLHGYKAWYKEGERVRR